ncbi:hypothetical protein [Pantoea sp. B65]
MRKRLPAHPAGNIEVSSE